MQIFPDRKRIRLPGYSYSTPGCYFITICAANREPLFGSIKSGNALETPSVVLSSVGEAIARNIQFISSAYPQIAVEKSIIMPNHVHLLMCIQPGKFNLEESRNKMLIVKCIQSFKASVTRQVSSEIRPVWQARFHDHVVRNEADYLRIWEYIDNNPAKWAEDCCFIG